MASFACELLSLKSFLHRSLLLFAILHFAALLFYPNRFFSVTFINDCLILLKANALYFILREEKRTHTRDSVMYEKFTFAYIVVSYRSKKRKAPLQTAVVASGRVR